MVPHRTYIISNTAVRTTNLVLCCCFGHLNYFLANCIKFLQIMQKWLFDVSDMFIVWLYFSSFLNKTLIHKLLKSATWWIFPALKHSHNRFSFMHTNIQNPFYTMF